MLGGAKLMKSCEKIRLSKVCKSFATKRLFSDLSLEFPKGEISFIVGESGSGKTTLLHMVAGIEPMDSGKIKGLCKERVSVVFQEPRLISSISVLSNLRLVSDASFAELNRYVNEFGVNIDLHQKVSELSGGMKQRISIIRALIAEPSLLLLDEPFKSLDVRNKKIVMHKIRDFARGKTLILSTHDEEEISFFNTDNSSIIRL